MAVTILHWHGVCPHCERLACFYVNYIQDENGIKMPQGLECDNCKSWISDEDFFKLEKIDVACPSRHLRFKN